MCEVKVNGVQCRRTDRFWVMTNRDISWPGNPEVGVEPFKSRANQLVCSAHLGRAVRELNALNHGAVTYCDPSRDGVTVKVKHVNPKTGMDFWA
jgi:hypothetical protein